VDALKKCDNDPHVIIAVAVLFDKDRKFAKARKWFERAVALNDKLGDGWAHLYAFELKQAASSAANEDKALQNEDKSLVDEVCRRCVAAAPNRGELWCSVAKHASYRHADVATVLKKVVEIILTEAKENLSDVYVQNYLKKNEKKKEEDIEAKEE
jgi:pre-mRNA-processing factor 6